MVTEQVFSKSIERCFNYVMDFHPLKDCFRCTPDETNKYCREYWSVTIHPPVYRIWNCDKKPDSCNYVAKKQKE